ncbi:MAG: 4Fe-4S binding protein [Prevotellaceae bacterium]|jgi:NADH-quinone oxidoreductase subunit I|nr:4Fe-4S binding protein [Prevotellaceae bacterium]
MNEFIKYTVNIAKGLHMLCSGMYITMLNMIRPKITEQYPENRGKKTYFENFRGELVMPHNENNEHKCTACGICMMNCPNGTIQIVTSVLTDETGKNKKALDRYVYDLGSCIFCALCTSSCPQGAIQWTNAFEHAVYTKDKLKKQLNREGSTLMTKNRQ